MKVSLRWLSEYVDLPEDPLAVRHALESVGHEVEGVETIEPRWTGVVVAEVLTVDPHPDADKVRVCTVSTGADPIQVVCGAWNFEAGARVAFAIPGAVLPGDFGIGTRRIRGVESNGMICSERELELGDDHSGILVLDDDAPVGSELAGLVELPDTVIELSITPNRPDAMSMVGIARDLAALFGTALKTPDVSVPTVAGQPTTTITIEDPSGCYRFTARELRDVAIGSSPFWMRLRLRKAGMRPISNAVDVTNYVMLEMGHPLHAFDSDRIRGDMLEVRRAHPGEKLVTLDDVERDLVPEDLVIADAEGATSLAGTMGGAESEVADGTKRILLEAASWDPPTIMWMSRRHNLRSEASARFERGVDRELPLAASARAAQLLLASGGGRLLEGVIDVVAVPYARPVIELPISEVERVLGPGIDAEECARHLSSIGLSVEGTDPLQVEIPGVRPDLERPVDLIEEIARFHGYDTFGETVPTGFGGGWTPEQRRAIKLRAALRALGLDQAVHLSFVGAGDLDALGLPADDPARAVVTVKNPLREEESLLRTTLLPGLLRTARFNHSHGADSVALFETGKVFFDRPSPLDSRIPDQPDRVAFVITGEFGDSGLGQPARPADIYVGTAIWRSLASSLGLTYRITAAEAPGFHPGRCARISLIDAIGSLTDVGNLGEVHPLTAAAFELSGRVVAAELDLTALTAPVPPHQIDTPSTYPPVEFDLAFWLPSGMTAADLLAATTDAAGPLVERVGVFDRYLADDGRTSLAIRYTLRHPERTLTNEDVAPIRAQMVAAGEALGAELRGKT
jgi:phenylalanyl-tRNA synthetase beta chain